MGPTFTSDLMLLASNNPRKVALNDQGCAAMPAFNADCLRRQSKIYQDLKMSEENLKAALEAVKEPAATQG